MQQLSRRTVRPMALLAALTTLGGCYTYAPVATAPEPGRTVSFALTDAGRVALGASVGPEARVLEGEIAALADAGYLLRMRSVQYVNGQTTQWSGEQLTVARQHVTNLRERRFSRKRTIALVAASVGGVVAFIASRGLLGIGSESDRRGGDGGGPTDQ
jgi:hypothetical protein